MKVFLVKIVGIDIWNKAIGEDSMEQNLKTKLTYAYNIAIKYGLCFDCRWKHDSEECHRYDCYVNSVKIIQDALHKLYEEEYEIGGK